MNLNNVPYTKQLVFESVQNASSLVFWLVCHERTTDEILNLVEPKDKKEIRVHSVDLRIKLLAPITKQKYL